MLYALALVVVGLVFWRAFARASSPTHGGGVVYRVNGAAKEYLLVTASKNPHRWVLPKGHIEHNETEDAAAVREVAEEAGVKATIVHKIGNVQLFKNFFTPINIAFFLMEYSGTVPTKEKRSCQWLPLEKAIEKASIKAHKKLLRIAANSIQ